MREIKFRGLTVNGDMVFGYLVFDLKNTTAYWNEYSQRICWHPETGGQTNAPVKNGTVGQYTGIKDFNGVDVYEGDIVKCENFVGEIISDDYEARFAVKTSDCFDSFALLRDEFSASFEVIGNIHQNPELLD